MKVCLGFAFPGLPIQRMEREVATYTEFNAPGNNTDFAGQPNVAKDWNDQMSYIFGTSTTSVSAYLSKHGGGTCQFYNPVTQGRAEPDLPASVTDIPWNGFPKKFDSKTPGQAPNYVGAEGPVAAGTNRNQDEYLEWFVVQKAGKIVSVQFTCEAYDYFQFLASELPAKVLELYQTYISPQVTMADLFPNGAGTDYDYLNKWNTELGAMHLTHPANNLFAEVFLAASATVRRSQHGAEITQTIPLIKCSQYGDAGRNSDPAIGAAVNGLARDGRYVTIADPVGLYMSGFNGAGLTLNGNDASGFFKVVRGAFPMALRAIYELTPELQAQGLTVSDVQLNGKPLSYGGQLAERITMHIAGRATVSQNLHNTPITTCGSVPQVKPPQPAESSAKALLLSSR
jgi:hypothetical protein